MKHSVKKGLLIFAFFALSLNFINAQTYPVLANVYIIPPYGSYLSDYYTSSREKLVVTLLNRDQQEPVLEAYLRMTVTSSTGLRIQNRPEINYPSITLDAGVPVRLSQEDLTPYFLPQNIIQQGYLNQGKLPNGMIEFTFQAIEKYTGKILSAPATGRIWLTTQKPPLLVFPNNHENVAFREPLNLKFQWQPQHNNISQVEYEFELREIPENGAAPQSAFLYSPIIHQERFFYTNFIYSAIHPMLDAGKTYGWRVRAIAKDGVDELNLFENNGYSEIFFFKSGSGCEPPVVTANVHDYQLDLTWQALDGASEYEVQFCNKYEGTGEWRKYITTNTHYTFYSLQLSSTYMYRVGTKCNNGSFVYGNVFEFKMPDVDSARLENCGMIPDIDLSNREPLQELNVGDVFMASDYPVTVTKVTNGSNGVFSGEGWVMLRWILNVRVAVEFENLPINTDKRATGGEVNFKYNKDWKNVGNLDGSGGNGGSDGQGIRIADTVIDFVIPGVDAFDLNCSDPTTDCEIIIHGENGETATIIIPRDSTGQLGLPYIIKDADGNTFIVDKNTTGQDSDVSVTSASSASVYPHFIGYAADLNESKVYFCNTQNVSEEEKLANAIQAKRQLIDNIIDCSVTVKEQGVFMSWYKAESIDILKQLKPQTMKFEIKLNGEIKNPDGNSIVIYKDDLLDDGESDCELSMINEETNTRKLMAKYKLSKYVPLPDTYYVIELEKDLAGNKRKDFYTDNGIAGHSNDEMPFADKEKIRLSILKIHRGIDTALYSTAQTEWYVNDTKIYTGAYFDYTIEQDIKNPIIKAVTDTNNIKVEIEIIKNPIADGRVNLDYSAVQNNSRDVADATNYFNASLPRCKTGDVGRFIDNSPKPVIVKVERRPATGGTVTQGEANDGADIKTSSYNKLDLKSINKDGYNAIIDAKLVSKLNPENVNGIQTSVNDGRPTQKTEILISRVARISQENADTLKAMINRKETRQGFLDSLVYEIREDDDISEWITFHNRDNIEIMINLENLGNDATANTPQKDFTRLMAHEFLHHYWTHFKQYEKLKWKIIRDKQTGYDYRLSDGMASGNAQDSNQGCSKGAGHERHNPEHSKVCNEQNSY